MELLLWFFLLYHPGHPQHQSPEQVLLTLVCIIIGVIGLATLLFYFYHTKKGQ